MRRAQMLVTLTPEVSPATTPPEVSQQPASRQIQYLASDSANYQLYLVNEAELLVLYRYLFVEAIG